MTHDAAKIRLILKLRQAGISDTQILSAIERVPREAFVPADFRAQAYDNKALPIAVGQTISQPTVVALMTQALEITSPKLKILEIGTGSGYQAAVLAQLVHRVYSLERHRVLMQRARALFAELRMDNITNKLADGYDGWPDQAPFDRIIVTCAAPEVPESLVAQLAPDGVLVLPMDDGTGAQILVKLRKTADGLTQEDSIPVQFVPMLRGTSAA